MRPCRLPMYYRDVGVTRHTFALAACAAVAVFTASAAARSAGVDMAASPSGKVAFSTRIFDRHDAFRIVVLNADGSEGRVLPIAPGHSFYPAWSPDATRIAFVSADFVGNHAEVWVMNSNGSGRHRLTRNGDQPAWSPDGRSIAFSRAGDLYVMSFDGSGKRKLTRNGTAPTWSPDGRRIAFVRAVAARCYRRSGPRCENSYEIYVTRADGTGQQRLTRNRVSEYNPDWSPIGSRIAYDRRRAPNGESHVFVMNADGTSQLRLADRFGASDSSWSPDGTKLVYMDANSIFTMNADGSGKRPLYPPEHGESCPECASPTWSRR